jgi:hypothetical protein
MTSLFAALTGAHMQSPSLIVAPPLVLHFPLFVRKLRWFRYAEPTRNVVRSPAPMCTVNEQGPDAQLTFA